MLKSTPDNLLAQRLEIDSFTTHLISAWRNGGATLSEINGELDRRILTCGQAVLKLYLITPDRFRLTNFCYDTLRYSYAIFKTAGHLPAITPAQFEELKPEISTWVLECRGVTKSGLMQCALALNLFSQIQLNDTPFIVYTVTQ